MRLLLDTHALIWWLAGDEALSNRAREAIADEANSVAVSAASAMEVAAKFPIGKLPDAALLAQDFAAIIADQGFVELLIAQAQAEDMALVSNEALFDGFAVKRLW